MPKSFEKPFLRPSLFPPSNLPAKPSSLPPQKSPFKAGPVRGRGQFSSLPGQSSSLPPKRMAPSTGVGRLDQSSFKEESKPDLPLTEESTSLLPAEEPLAEILEDSLTSKFRLRETRKKLLTKKEDFQKPSLKPSKSFTGSSLNIKRLTKRLSNYRNLSKLIKENVSETSAKRMEGIFKKRLDSLPEDAELGYQEKKQLLQDASYQSRAKLGKAGLSPEDRKIFKKIVSRLTK